MEPKRHHTPFGDHPNTYLATWLFYAVILFWPLLLPGTARVVVQVIWGAFVVLLTVLAVAGRRRRRREQAEQEKEQESPISRV